ncbi:MAG: type III pantothenate kinase [Pseudoalteromonas sp.]|uniref:type III pantothenate kinase n=1 Tax=Pseudoalteromonas sp. AOP31-A2-14 TaxID=3457695 RepID=UPI003FB82567
MKLLVDVGNSSVKIVLCQTQQLTPCEANSIPWSQVTELVYACVGKSEMMNKLLARATELGINCTEAKVTAELGKLKCAYRQVNNLGIDRWLVLIAAYSLWPKKNCIIIDAGTATTIDVLTDTGQHLGGWILPGLDLMTQSLTQNTQRVFDDKNTLFSNELGVNTPNGLKNGALVATIGAIEQAMLHLPDEAQIVLAGGYGALLQQHLPGSDFDSLLVMKGLSYWQQLSIKD